METVGPVISGDQMLVRGRNTDGGGADGTVSRSSNGRSRIRSNSTKIPG